MYTETETYRETPADDRGEDWSIAATSWRIPRIDRHGQKPGRGKEPHREHDPANALILVSIVFKPPSLWFFATTP